MRMLKPFQVIDDFLMDKLFQKFAHWWQKKFGTTCFVLAAYAFKFARMSGIAVTGYFIYHLYMKDSPILVFAPILVYFEYDNIKDMLHRLKLLRQLDEVFFSGNAGSMNSLRFDLMHIRMLVIVLEIFLLWFYAYVKMPIPILLYAALYCAANVVGHYFTACTPLPPCKGTVKEWLKSFGKQVQTVRVDN